MSYFTSVLARLKVILPRKIWGSLFLILAGLLTMILVLAGCNSSTPLVTRPQDSTGFQEDQNETSQVTNITYQSSLIVTSNQPINPDNHWIAWKDPNLGYIAASKSGIPVEVPNYPPSISLVPQATVALQASDGLGIEIFDPTGGPGFGPGFGPGGPGCDPGDPPDA